MLNILDQKLISLKYRFNELNDLDDVRANREIDCLAMAILSIEKQIKNLAKKEEKQ